ncbi:MAG: collagen-like protein [Draconibacterium sp.]
MKRKHFTTALFFIFFNSLSSYTIASLFRSKIDSIQIEFNPEQLVLPGESFEIGVSSYHKNGKIKKTFGMEGGSVLWWRYKVEVTGGTFRSGSIEVNERLMPSKGKYIEVKVCPKKQPELAKRMLIPLNYETEISFSPISDFDKAPGEIIEGSLVEKFNNGKTRVVTKLSRNKESDNFEFSGEGGSWEKGKFQIEPDFLKIQDHTVNIYVNSLRNPEISDTFSVLLDYKHSYRLSFGGRSGFSGLSGSNGFDGTSGYSGSDGSPGQNGEPGYNGPDLGVWADLYFDPILHCDLLYVYAENLFTGEEFRYLVNPDGGSFRISTRGGNGGDGGRGGRGGNGGNGRPGEIWYESKTITKIEQRPFTEQVVKKVKKHKKDEQGNVVEYEEDEVTTQTVYRDVEVQKTIWIEHVGPGGDGGDGGNGGPGGFGGPGGNGGDVFLYLTEDSWLFENLFTINNGGGSGGMNGSGGNGGNGGNGGSGNPNGRNGFSGNSGYSAIGWASDGWDGEIIKDTTDEFYIPNPQDEALSEKFQNKN